LHSVDDWVFYYFHFPKSLVIFFFKLLCFLEFHKELHITNSDSLGLRETKISCKDVVTDNLGIPDQHPPLERKDTSQTGADGNQTVVHFGDIKNNTSTKKESLTKKILIPSWRLFI